jgi:uncharacterized coiled-coil protein SlyX
VSDRDLYLAFQEISALECTVKAQDTTIAALKDQIVSMKAVIESQRLSIARWKDINAQWKAAFVPKSALAGEVTQPSAWETR